MSGKTDTEQQLVRLGEAIRSLRRAAAMSQETLADNSGIDRSHLGRIERGERNLTFLNLARIADALKVRASQIVADAEL